MIREVDLVSYLPLFLADYRETHITLTAENPEFNLVWRAADKALYNEFIATADEYGIKRFERILGIYPSDTDTLEIRRRRVQSRWFNAAPYTIRMLEKKMTELLGDADYFSIWTSFMEAYELRLTIYNTEDLWFMDSHVRETRRLLASMVPLNIRYRLNYQFGIGIDYRGLERYKLQKINMHLALPFFLCRTLDGSWKLDGEIYLCEKRRYQLAVRLRNTIRIFDNYSGTGTALEFSAETHAEQSVYVRTDCLMNIRTELPEEEAGVRMHAGISSGCGDIRNTAVTNKTRDCWFLDGGMMLDGSRKLDSVFIRRRYRNG